jgi:hypothetical protein
MPDLENLTTDIQNSRRNLMKMGAIAASVVVVGLTKSKPAAARGGNNDDDDGDDRDQKKHKCFLKGTRIRTVKGDRKLEELAVGDMLPTAFDGTCPIQWIGRYRFRKSDPTMAWVKDVRPVRIARSALGPDVPHADLYVTKGHALLIDGVLVNAGSLINGTTITLYDPGERDELEYFHIKLARHNVIYAEGAPCETLLDVDENAANFAEYFRRYGLPATGEMPCAPLLGFNGGRSEIKSRFRSALSPWIDCRHPLDIIRDRLEERGIALARQSELTF